MAICFLTLLCMFRTVYFTKPIENYTNAFVVAKVKDIYYEDSYILKDVVVDNEIKIDKKVLLKTKTKLNRGDIIRYTGSFYDTNENMYSRSIVKESTGKDISVMTNDNGIDLLVVKDIIDKTLGEKGSIIKGILFGDTTGIDKDTYRIFSIGGYAHILAVSGLHVGIVYAFFDKILGKWNFVVKNIVIAILIGMFASVTGFSPSVVRASTMISIKLLCDILGKRYSLVNSAVITCCGMLIVNPYYVYSKGFVLSFLCVLGIGRFYNYFNKKIKIKYIGEAVSMYFATQILTIPMVALYFNEVGFLGIITNMVVVPFVNVVMFMSVLGIVVSPFTNIVLILTAEITLVAQSILGFLVENVPLSIVIEKPNPYIIGIFYILMFWVCLLDLEKKEKDV